MLKLLVMEGLCCCVVAFTVHIAAWQQCFVYHRAFPFESNLMEVLNEVVQSPNFVKGILLGNWHCVILYSAEVSGCHEASCCVPLSLYVVSFGLE
jgi:hypothetical protein